MGLAVKSRAVGRGEEVVRERTEDEEVVGAGGEKSLAAN